MTTTDWTTDAKGTGQYAEVNGINLYFESHGAAAADLLHGGLDRRDVRAGDSRGGRAPPGLQSTCRGTADPPLGPPTICTGGLVHNG